MLDLQFEEPLPPRELRQLRVLPLWLFPNNIPAQALTSHELLLSSAMTSEKAKQYKHSRSHLRIALSQLWDVPPLEIPLNALPGKAPKLAKGWGYISISHCSDALIISWSIDNIGVDIERSDREFSADKISDRYYFEREKKSISGLKGESYNKAVLKKWITKEACIKWQQGSIKSDLSEWECIKNTNIVKHNSLGYEVNVSHLKYGPWMIAVAYKDKKPNRKPRICLDYRIQDSFINPYSGN